MKMGWRWELKLRTNRTLGAQASAQLGKEGLVGGVERAEKGLSLVGPSCESSLRATGH